MYRYAIPAEIMHCQNAHVIVLYLVLQHISNGELTFQATRDQFASMSGLSRRTVDRTLAQLRTLGYVTWETRHGNFGGNVYTITAAENA